MGAQPAARRSRSHGLAASRAALANQAFVCPRTRRTARVVTSCGTFEVELDSKDAPITGGSFVSLARKGFYDDLIFHRIVTGFVIQGGDPPGPVRPAYRVREAPPSDIVYSEGVVAMAKAGNEPPGTSGSQFFVVTSDSSLPPEYALLGRVKKGLDVVHAIEEVPAGPDERPISPVVIDKIDVRGEVTPNRSAARRCGSVPGRARSRRGPLSRL